MRIGTNLSLFREESSTFQLVSFAFLAVIAIGFCLAGTLNFLQRPPLFPYIVGIIVPAAALAPLYMIFVFIPALREIKSVASGAPSKRVWASCYACTIVSSVMFIIWGVAIGLAVAVDMHFSRCETGAFAFNEVIMRTLIFVFFLSIPLSAFGAIISSVMLLFVGTLSCLQTCCGDSDHSTDGYDLMDTEMGNYVDDEENQPEPHVTQSSSFCGHSSLMHPPLLAFSIGLVAFSTSFIALFLYQFVMILPQSLPCEFSDDDDYY